MTKINYNDKQAVDAALADPRPNALKVVVEATVDVLARYLRKNKDGKVLYTRTTGIYLDNLITETAAGAAGFRRVKYVDVPLIPAYQYRCRQCGHQWTTLSTYLPDRCGSCRSMRWWDDKPAKRGRPRL